MRKEGNVKKSNVRKERNGAELRERGGAQASRRDVGDIYGKEEKE